MNSGIIRVSKRERYAVISHDMLRDARLSFAARGLLAYLLSRPDNWSLQVADLVKQSSAGKHAVNVYLRELEAHGYLKRERKHSKAGHFAWESTVYESPQNPEALSEPFTENQVVVPITHEKPNVSPLTDLPEMATPLMVNQPLKKERTKEVTSKEINTSGATAPVVEIIPDISPLPETDHQRLMRELQDRTGPIPDGRAQGQAVKWILEHYPPEQAVACLDWLLSESWRTSRVSWLTVKKEIGAFVARQNSGVNNATTQRRPSYSERTEAGMDAVYAFTRGGGDGGGGGEDHRQGPRRLASAS